MEMEITGKTIEEAVDNACKELELTKDEFTYEIIEYPNKGFLGIGSKNALIKVYYKKGITEDSKKYINDLFRLMGVSGNYDIEAESSDNKHTNIVLKGESVGFLTKKHGELIEAIQNVLALAMNKKTGAFCKVSMDVNDYREKEAKKVEELALKLSEKALKTRRKIFMKPMSSYQRRIVHSTLQNVENITTYSIGEEPNRKVIIAYRGADDKRKNYNPERQNKSKSAETGNN